MEKQEERSWEEIQKRMQEDEDRNFLEEAAKIRHRSELLGAYGLDFLQSFELMKLMTLEEISSTLESMDQSLKLLSNVLADAQVKNPSGSAIAVTGMIQTCDY